MVELAPLSLATTPEDVDLLQTTNPSSHEDVGKVSTPPTENEQNEQETSASPVKDGPVPIAGSLQKNEEEEGPPFPSAEGGPPQIMGSPQPTEGDKEGTLLAAEDGLQYSAGCLLQEGEDEMERDPPLSTETEPQRTTNEGTRPPQRDQDSDRIVFIGSKDQTLPVNIPVDPKKKSTFINSFMGRLSCWSTVSSGPLDGTGFFVCLFVGLV